MRDTRSLRYIILAISVAFLAYLLLPLTGDDYPIVFDETLIREKEQFLSDERQRFESRDIDDERPNVVLIVADDLGKTDITLYGTRYDLGGAAVPTPRIDSIGLNGVIFTEAYCPSPICSPSRAGILTGRLPSSFGMEYQPHSRYPRNRLELFAYDNLVDMGNWTPVRLPSYPGKRDIANQMLPPSEITIAELLKATGYDTAIMGKWHLNLAESARPDAYGFEEHYGFYEAFTLYARKNDPDMVEYRHDNFQSRHIWRRGRKGLSAIVRNGKKVREKGYLTFRIAEEANRYIEQDRVNPFFLMVSFNAPHTPFQAPKSHYDRFPSVEDNNKRVYYAMISALDDAVGSILDALEETGQAESTMVIFASDNGGATYTGATANDPLKGGKFTQFEGGINIPFAISWPGKITARTSYEEPVSLTDLFPTLGAIGGAGLPSDRRYDGVDLMPYITQQRWSSPHNALYWRSGYAMAIRTGTWKMLVDTRTDKRILYNMFSDKEERNDVAAVYPDVVEELFSDLSEWEATLPEPLWPPVMDYRFILDGEPYDYRI